MDVRIYQEIAKINEKRVVSIVNPISKDFYIKHKGKPFSIEAQEEKEFPFYVAERFVKVIADYMVGKKQRIVGIEEREGFENRIRLYEQEPTS